MTHTIIHKRTDYKPNSTLGRLILPFVPFTGSFAYTLEDTVRADGVKVSGYTAIPSGLYNVGVRYSPKFKRDVLVLYNKIIETSQGKLYIIEKNGVKFTNVLAHGGNDFDDTEGCVLVASNAITDKFDYIIHGTLEHDLFEIVKPYIDSGDTIMWEVINLPQTT